MNLAEKIKNRRIELGVSQELLAEKLGISRQAVSKWESDQSNPSTANLLELSKILNVDISYFINEDEENFDLKKNISKGDNIPEKEEVKEMGFFLNLLFVIIGGVFFVAYYLLMDEVFNLPFRDLPWLILTFYMAVAVFAFPYAYSRTKGLRNMDYFIFSRVMLPLIYLVSPIVLIISIIKSNV